MIHLRQLTSGLLPLFAIGLTALAPGLAAAEGVGRCIQDVDTYRSLVVHRADDNGRLIQFPNQSFELLENDRAVEEPTFWFDPDDPSAKTVPAAPASNPTTTSVGLMSPPG